MYNPSCAQARDNLDVSLFVFRVWPYPDYYLEGSHTSNLCPGHQGHLPGHQGNQPEAPRININTVYLLKNTLFHLTSVSCVVHFTNQLWDLHVKNCMLRTYYTGDHNETDSTIYAEHEVSVNGYYRPGIMCLAMLTARLVYMDEFVAQDCV